MNWNDENLVKVLKKGGVAVMPTDTIYGIVGSALNKNTVERIYELRNRNPDKPCIILVSGPEELEKFSITLTNRQKEMLEKFWSFGLAQDKPEPTSVVLDCLDEKFAYLHRGTKTLAFRVPAVEPLKELLKKTGPLIAPSANPVGMPPSKNIEEAKKYFSDSVDLYVDGGEISGKPSQVVRLNDNGSLTILRG